MTNKRFDSERYKANQRKRWDAAATGWKRWSVLFEQAAAPVSEMLLELAEIKAGDRVLDIATGLGEPALPAARRVGAEGHVWATDQSSEMVVLARRRALEAGMQNMTFQRVDAEQLVFPARHFNAIISRWGLMFLPNLPHLLARLRPMLLPGGKFATAIWAPAEEVPSLSLAFQVVQQVFAPPAPPAGTPTLFGLANGVLEQMLKETGYQDVQSQNVTVTLEYASTEAFIEYLRGISPPLRAFLSKHPPEEQQQYWQTLAHALQPYANQDDQITIHNQAICVVATDGG